MDLATLAVSIIVPVITSGGIVAWYERKARLQKALAEAEKTRAEAELVQAQARKVDAECYEIESRATARVREVVKNAVRPFRERLDYLGAGINILISQLVRAGITPEWTPETWRPEDTE